MLLKVEIDDVRATGGIFCCANYFSSIFYLSTKKKIYSSSNYISSAFFIDSGHTQKLSPYSADSTSNKQSKVANSSGKKKKNQKQRTLKSKRCSTQTHSLSPSLCPLYKCEICLWHVFMWVLSTSTWGYCSDTKIHRTGLWCTSPAPKWNLGGHSFFLVGGSPPPPPSCKI